MKNVNEAKTVIKPILPQTHWKSEEDCPLNTYYSLELVTSPP